MNKKYTNGYLGKIKYWSGRLEESSSYQDITEIEFCMEKLKYFVGRHKEWVSKNKYSDVETNTYEGSRERLGTFLL